MGRSARISNHHRLALVMSAQNRLRAKAMDIAYVEILGEAPPNEADLTDTDRDARMGLARKWDARRDEIRSAIADGGSWHTIAARLEPGPVEAPADRDTPAAVFASTRLHGA